MKKIIQAPQEESNPLFSNPISFEGCQLEYEKQYRKQMAREIGSDGERFFIDYNQISDLIKLAAKNSFPELNQKQLDLCWSKAYDDYHSSFGDCIWGMNSICSFVKDVIKQD